MFQISTFLERVGLCWTLGSSSAEVNQGNGIGSFPPTPDKSDEELDRSRRRSILRRPSSQSSLESQAGTVCGYPIANEILLHIFSYLDAPTLACYCSQVSRHWRSLALRSIQGRDHAGHEHYMLLHSQKYIEGRRYFDDINSHLAYSAVPMVVCGASGSGKTTIVTNWIMRHCQKHANTIILYHYIGTPNNSTDYMMLMYRLLSMLKTRANITEDIPNTIAHMSARFQAWLTEASQRHTIVIVIDGLDQIYPDDVAYSLEWLPRQLPPRVKMLLTISDGMANVKMLKELFRERNWRRLNIDPLGVDERARIIGRLLSANHRQLGFNLIEEIVTSKPTGNPLFLSIFVEYLLRLNPSKCIDERIHKALRCQNVHDLFDHVCEELEEHFHDSQGLVQDFLTCLHISRSGLSQTEIEELLHLDSDQWERLYASVSPSIVLRSGSYSFFHEGLRQAVGRRYFASDPNAKRAAMIKLIDYFDAMLKSGTITASVVDELPWLLEKVGDHDHLKQCISNIRLFDRLFQRERKYDLFRYWVTTSATGADIARLYQENLDAFERDPHNCPKEVARIAHKLGEYIRDGGHYNEAIPFFDKALRIKQVEYGEFTVEVATTMNELGRLYFRLGRNEETLYMWKRALEIREAAKGGREDHDIAISLNNLALIYEKMGNWEDAEPTYLRALEIYKRVSGHDHPDVAITYHNLGLLYSSHNNRLKDSQEMYHKALAIKEKFYGKDHNELAMTLNNLGLVYSKLNELHKAAELYKKAIDIRESIFGSDHPDVALFLFNLGVCYGKMNKLDLAKPCLFRALKIRRRVYGVNHQSTNVVRSWIQYFRWQNEEEFLE